MKHAITPYARVAWRTGLVQCLVALAACGGGGGGGGGGSDDAVNASQAGLNTVDAMQVNGLVEPVPFVAATYDVVMLEADPAMAPLESINASGQVAFTSLRPDGPHALLYNGRAIQDLGLGYMAAINDAAQIAGYTTTSPAHALRWTTAGRTTPAVIDLGAPAGGSSTARAINAAGQVAGVTEHIEPVVSGQFSSHPFVWTEGLGMLDLSTLPIPGFFPVSANHVNALGQVTGGAFSTFGNPLAGLPSHAFLWTPGSGIRDLGTLGRGDVSSATALNDEGQVAGSSNIEFGPLRGLPNRVRHHAFLWTAAAGMQDLGTLGGRNSDALALNALGQVVGNSDTANGTDPAAAPLGHAFFWSPTGPTAGRMLDLGTLAGGVSSATADLNDSGQVVGTSGTSATSPLPHAFIWTAAEGLVDLNTRIPTAPAGLTVTLATAISEGGAILGYADRKLVLLKPSGDSFASARLAIASPPGAYRPYPGLAGRATFSTRIRAEETGQKPRSQTRFQLASAGLHFESSGYDWLNVQGARAQYQGSGSLNGASGYKFRVTLIDGTKDGPGNDGNDKNDRGHASHNNSAHNADGAADRLRIRIWHLDAAQGASMLDYDNQLDASTEGTAIQSGNHAVQVRQAGKAQERHAGR
ncbi:hypothetical protein [Polaromonas sp. CG_23.6]|uniref:hypothetical protein n=1 Tax=Polaromonas sp. CG_23.6 TaxID=2760709 RepID=UPI002473386B|nr:hypothetical protein [Polaromonas sp. CG_23.6]MDH6186028.1 putative HAF family extracellular repeat protein [Polaromonas sp. CG_23.6]